MSEPQPPFLFVVTLTGREAEGEKLTVLAFTLGDDKGAARQRAREELEALGWAQVEVVRCGEVIRPEAVPSDFVPAMATARRHGCGLIIYEQD